MFEDLLKSSRKLADDGQAIGDIRPAREDDRGLVGSRHARLADHMEAPDDDLSLEQAELLCAEVTRAWLGDFAPALVLLKPDLRRRMQAALTLSRTSIDFALQPGVEGERMTALNRLQFELEEALDGNPRGQPAYLLIASEEQREPWNRDAWDRFFERMRHVAMAGSLETAKLRTLADALADAIVEVVEHEETTALSGALATVIGQAESLRLIHDGGPLSMAVASTGSGPWSKFVAYVGRADDHLTRSGPRKPLSLFVRLWLLGRSLF